MRRFLIVVAGFAVLQLSVCASAALAVTSADIDQGFGVHGIVLTPWGPGINRVTGLAFQPDGKLLVAGTYAHSNVAASVIARYDAMGALDPTFGTGGIATVDATSAMTVNMGGTSDIYVRPTDDAIFIGSTKLFPDGSLDTSFRDTLHLPASASHLAFQPDGKFVVAGTITNEMTGADLALWRFNADGTPDASFGVNGQALGIDLFNRTQDVLNAVAILPDGKILAVGSTGAGMIASYMVIVRCNADGSLDSTFGTGGMIIQEIQPGGLSSPPQHIVPLPDGSFYFLWLSPGVAPSYEGNCKVQHRTSDGQVDWAFGTDGGFHGISGYRLPSDPLYKHRMMGTSVFCPQPDGSILFGGRDDHGIPTFVDYDVMRMKADGLLDESFGAGGVLTLDFGAADDCGALGVAADGKIVIAGQAFVTTVRTSGGAAGRSTGNAFAMARFRNDVVHFTAPGLVSLKSGFRLSWENTYAGAAIAKYSIRWREARYDRPLSSNRTLVNTSAKTSAPFTGEPGCTYLFSGTGIGPTGEVTPWSPGYCVTVPLSSTALQAGKAWSRGRATGCFGGRYVKATKAWAGLSLPGIRSDIDRIVLLVTTGPTMGKVRVRFTGARVGGGYVNLWSKTLKRCQAITVPVKCVDVGKRVTLVIEPTTKKPVIIEGVALIKKSR
jgi:uncharacterized delta-60 repeat protein